MGPILDSFPLAVPSFFSHRVAVSGRLRASRNVDASERGRQCVRPNMDSFSDADNRESRAGLDRHDRKDLSALRCRACPRIVIFRPPPFFPAEQGCGQTAAARHGRLSTAALFPHGSGQITDGLGVIVAHARGMNSITEALTGSWDVGAWIPAFMLFASAVYVRGWSKLHKNRPDRFG